MQIVRMALGKSTLAVFFNQRHQPFVGGVIKQCGLLDADCDSGIDARSLKQDMSRAILTRELQTNTPIWAKTSSQTANWAAVSRPCVYLGNNATGTLSANDADLQRTLVQLIAGTFEAVNASEQTYQALRSSWANLTARCKYQRSDAPKIPQIIKPVDALGFWVSRAIATHAFEVSGKTKTLNYKKNTAYRTAKETITFHKGSLNEFIEAQGYARWDIPNLISGCLSSAGFVSTQRINRLDTFTIKRNVLDRYATAIVNGIDAKSTGDAKTA
jgi:hypothetical protein